jgi:hypothetical protein
LLGWSALTTSSVFCIWYPSGGFGHFINAILLLYGEKFLRPTNSLEFSTNGNSHSLDLVVPKYFHESWPGGFEFSEFYNYSVLIDNGINNESLNFKSVFPDAKVIKICYTDHSWPIIARTMIEKAMNSNIEHELPLDEWGHNNEWAIREKYFLYLRDHPLRFQWNTTTPGQYAIYIDEICDYNTLFSAINKIVTVSAFKQTWHQWRIANDAYIAPVEHAKNIMDCVKSQQLCDITHVKDSWTQAMVYYFIWLEYAFEVPHNDYASWFTNTKEIVTMLRDHGVNFDSI